MIFIRRCKKIVIITTTIHYVNSIQSSPSCDPTRGVYMEEVQKLFKDNDIPIEHDWFLSNDEQPVFDENKHVIRHK